jgi:hypothetical protein
MLGTPAGYIFFAIFWLNGEGDFFVDLIDPAIAAAATAGFLIVRRSLNIMPSYLSLVEHCVVLRKRGNDLCLP